jgi:hypothetical protein
VGKCQLGAHSHEIVPYLTVINMYYISQGMMQTIALYLLYFYECTNLSNKLILNILDRIQIVS